MSKEIKLEKKHYTKDMPFKEKVLYFWDYYKWHTIIGFIVLIALISFIKDVTTNNDPDFTVLYAGSAPIGLTAREDGEAALNAIIPDINKDGVVYAVFMPYSFSEDGSMTQMDIAQQMSMFASMSVGDAYVMVLDEEYYQNYKEQSAYANLNELFGLTLNDPYSIPFSDTKLYTLSGLSTFPSDSHVVVFQRFLNLKDSKKVADQNFYQNTFDLLKDLIA